MDTLFRFVLLRPAVRPDTAAFKVLSASFIDPAASVDASRAEAARFAASERFVRDTNALAHAHLARRAAEILRAGPQAADAVRKVVVGLAGRELDTLVAEGGYVDEERRVVDSLVAMKLLSSSNGADAPDLTRIAQGYDAIRMAAASSGDRKLSLRALVAPHTPVRSQPTVPSPYQRPSSAREEADPMVARIRAALTTLRRLPAAAFDSPSLASPLANEPGARQEARAAVRPWRVSANAVPSGDVLATLAALELDLGVHGLPAVLYSLHEELARRSVGGAVSAGDTVSVVGSWLVPEARDGYVGPPRAPLPTSPGGVRNVGIGDLLVVKQHVLRYEGGELAHVENVLKTEHLSRETRRLDRTESIVVRETEATKEEERDNQTTDRFSLKREAAETLKTDSELKAGLSVDAKYGPTVEVKATADYSTKTATESATKQASEFGKDVVSRSVAKVVDRVLERRTVTTLVEFEEKYSHGFDNTSGTKHVSGVYQWVDKVQQSQVYNYGKRVLFDLVVPEPSTAFVEAQTTSTREGASLSKPPPFSLAANEIDESNYRAWAHRYDVVGLEPPPPAIRTVSKTFDATLHDDPHEATKSDVVTIDEGYAARYALCNRHWASVGGSSAYLYFLVGNNAVDGLGGVSYVDLAGEQGSVSIAYTAFHITRFVASIEIFCERTERAFEVWQLKTHGAITQGYLAKARDYEQALTQAQTSLGVAIAGKNPGFNGRLVAAELKKECISLLTAQHFDAFGALELSAEGYPQPSLARSAEQMPYVRFFEQAFEWEHLTYVFYPYFWGWKPGWKNRMLLDDVDPLFADFLRAGASRVVFPVRPGFEEAVAHYLETGEIWNGGPAPAVSSPTYVSIIKEIQEAEGAPGAETPVGEPWLVRLPTTLVRVRPNDDLPKWKKAGEDWQPDPLE